MSDDLVELSEPMTLMRTKDVRHLLDRIEELEAKLATCEKYRDAYAEMGRIGTEAYRDLEAKLTKAVEECDETLNQLDSARHSIDVLERRVAELKHTES